LKKFDAFEATCPIEQGLLRDFAGTERLRARHPPAHRRSEVSEKELTEHKLDEVVIEATVAGDYNGVVRFVNQLQRSKNVYIVDALQLESDTRAGPATF